MFYFCDKILEMNSFQLKIKDKIQLTPKAVKLVFDIPEALTNAFSFLPGQYITLKVNVNDEEVRRSYSICSSPDEDLAVAVKAIDNGVFSNYANSMLKVGDEVEVFTPEGTFIMDKDLTNKNYIAFVAGSGITPLMAMIKSFLASTKTGQFVLVYANKTAEEAMFLDTLQHLQENNPNQFHLELAYSREKKEGAQFGRIERPLLNFFENNKYKSIDFNQHFLCGPEEMIENLTSVLKENSIPDSKIKYELFFSAKEKQIEEGIDGQTKIKVIVDDEEFEFSMLQKERILDATLAQEIDAPYSCQGGICSSCVAKVKEGEAAMAKNQILTDDEVAEGLILTCQAHPTSSSITIDYDDV